MQTEVFLLPSELLDTALHSCPIYLFQKSTNRRGILSYMCLVCGEGERERIDGKILCRDRQGTVGWTGVWFPVPRFLERFLS